LLTCQDFWQGLSRLRIREARSQLVAEGIPEVDAHFVAAIELGIIDVDEEGVDYNNTRTEEAGAVRRRAYA